MLKICAECGLEFEAKGTKKYCNREHYRTCVICNSKFLVPNHILSAKDARTTCSKKCNAELRKQTNMIKYGGVAPACSSSVQEKMKQTNKERYGVEHALQSEEIMDKLKSTNKERYGVEYGTQTEANRDAINRNWNDVNTKQNILNKRKQTNLERYGVECCFSNEDIRNKCKTTYKAKTGYETPFANPDVQKKIEDTNLERYGVARPCQSKEIQSKVKQTNLDRYGTVNPMQNKQVLAKAQKTCLERYGNTCYLQSDLGLQKTHDAMKSRYNTRWFSQSAKWKIERMLDSSKVDELVAFRENPQLYISSHYKNKPSIKQLSYDLGIHENSIHPILVDNNCVDSVDYVYSYMETDVYNALKSIDSAMIIERNTKQVITPYELDIYLPEYNIGIECNPTSTHNSSVNTFDVNGEPLSYNYHLKKTKMCEDKGVFLFHIFGSEWTYSRSVIISMIKNLLGKTTNRLYARECEIREVSAKECSEFLNNNHRQGSVNSPIRLGLYYKDELVSVMTFGKMRNTIGQDNTDLSDCYELVRFCSLLDTSVVGGASKLFKHFCKTYNPFRVRSFSDRAHTKGTLYSTLGFVKLRESDPGYVWVDTRTDISYHRYSAQKQNIQKFLHDDDIDLSKTEKQIMEEHRFVQVFDCGTILWEYVNT